MYVMQQAMSGAERRIAGRPVVRFGAERGDSGRGKEVVDAMKKAATVKNRVRVQGSGESQIAATRCSSYG
jgi:hypothetical protein